jgi:hypothetical protein
LEGLVNAFGTEEVKSFFSVGYSLIKEELRLVNAIGEAGETCGIASSYLL